ncbi:MAG: glycosyltransferase [Candidatus Azobacteroides sp.]|nr:glycosyltransferase [Candidatus Azobacteroides sp.]
MNSIIDSYNRSQKKITYELIIIIDSPEEYLSNDRKIDTLYPNMPNLRISINEKNSGVAYSRNKGLDISQYDFVTFIDQDDQVNYNYFRELESLAGDPYHFILFNGYRYHADKNTYRKIYYIKPDITFTSLIKQHFVLWTPGLMIINKKKIEVKDLFIDVSPEFRGCDDWFAILNITRSYPEIKFLYVNKPLFIINRHEENFSNDIKHMFDGQIAILKYFQPLVDSTMQKRIKKLIEIRNFELKKRTNLLTKKDIFRSRKKIYFSYLFNKWIYRGYPLLKLRRTFWPVLGKIDMLDQINIQKD